MIDYKKMYLEIFTAAEKAIKLLGSSDSQNIGLNASKASIILIESQLECEEIYLNGEDSQIRLIG